MATDLPFQSARHIAQWSEETKSQGRAGKSPVTACRQLFGNALGEAVSDSKGKNASNDKNDVETTSVISNRAGRTL